MNTSRLKEWLPPIAYRSLCTLAYQVKFLSYGHKELLPKT